MTCEKLKHICFNFSHVILYIGSIQFGKKTYKLGIYISHTMEMSTPTYHDSLTLNGLDVCAQSASKRLWQSFYNSS